MTLTLIRACILVTICTLISLSTTAPSQASSQAKKRAVTGPVIFLSNCFGLDGTQHAEFNYYEDASESILGGTSTAPTLTNVINPTTAVDYVDGGTFVTAGTVQDFIAIISIDENDFQGPGSHVGNGKSTTWFWAQACYESSSETVYNISATETCTSSIYCAQGPKDPEDE